ncbi:MAG: hypothetical protein RIS88_2702 [Pseudomonadota bacterium]|jgi:enamine deaminase RidA (YjgF/YER057c/UK114 family)
MSSIRRIDQNDRRSRAVIHDRLICLAGQVANDLSGDIRQQAREAFAKVDDLLAQAGSDKTRVLNVTIWLADVADYDAFNAVWDAWVVQGQTPARACAQVKFPDPRVRVELLVTAAGGAA